MVSLKQLNSFWNEVKFTSFYQTFVRITKLLYRELYSSLEKAKLLGFLNCETAADGSFIFT